MQSKKSSILEAVLNVIIGVIVVAIVTQHIGATLIIVACSTLRIYALRRLFTSRGK